MSKGIPSYMRSTNSAQAKDTPFQKTNTKIASRPSATPPDPVLEHSFRGHKDTITSVGFNPNL